MRSLILAVDRKAGALASLLARILLVLAALSAFWQVTSRFVLQNPAVWTEILTRTLLIWCVFIGAAVAIRRGALVSVDLLMQLSGRNKALRLAVATSQAAFLALLCYVGLQMAWLARFQNMVALDISMSWGYLAIPVGALLGLLSTFAQYLDPTDAGVPPAL